MQQEPCCIPFRRPLASFPLPAECFWEFQPENVAAVFTGWLHTATSGWYAFTLESDDGSRLLLDGALAVDNGGACSWCWELCP